MAEKPKPLDEFREKYNASIANTFIFYGATFDYPSDTKTLKECLIDLLTKNRDSEKRKNIIFYDKADGITFPGKKDGEVFRAAVAKELSDMFMGVLPQTTAQAFYLIGKALQRNHFALIIEFAETVFPDSEQAVCSENDRVALVSLLKWAKDEAIAVEYGNPIMLITNSLSRVNIALREPSSRIEAIGLPYPDTGEREKFIKSAINVYKDSNGMKVEFEDGFDVPSMARATAGLAKVHIGDIINKANMVTQKVPLGLNLVKDRKNDIIKAEFQDGLRIEEPSYGFEYIFGHDHIKEFFRKNIINAIKLGNKLRVPMGVLMCGPAGTGKTELAKALAYECGFNCVSLNPGRLKNRYVGASEEKTEKALWSARSLSPVIVTIDELDTAISREGNNDSGVSQNQMKMLLEFMSDPTHRGEIVFIAATNRPENIDFALKRTGRLDKKIPVLPPSAAERPHLFMGFLKKHNIKHNITLEDVFSLEREDVAGWGDGMDNYVGSDIEEIVRKAYEIAEDSGKDCVDIGDIKLALSLIKPSVQDIAAMVASAINECNDLSLLPAHYRLKDVKKNNTRKFERDF